MLRHGWPGARQSRDRAAALERGRAGRREGRHPTTDGVLFLISEHVWSRRFKASSSQLLVRDILFLLLLFAVPTGAFLCAFDRRLAATGTPSRLERAPGQFSLPILFFPFLVVSPSLSRAFCLSFFPSFGTADAIRNPKVRTHLLVRNGEWGGGGCACAYVRARVYLLVCTSATRYIDNRRKMVPLPTTSGMATNGHALRGSPPPLTMYV